jgi:hypothetical protein
MDSENKFWAVFWCCVTVFLVAVIVSVTIISWHNNKIMLEMVKAGGDPLEVSCAVEGGKSRDCAILMGKK